MITLGNNLKKLRIEKGWSQFDLATKLDVSQTSVAHYEAGTRQPTIETLIKLSSTFQVSVDSLLGVQQSSEGATLDLSMSELSNQMIECILQNNRGQLWTLVEQLQKSLDLKTILEDVLKDVLYNTGEMWKNGTITEVEEHLISNMIQKIIGTLSYNNKDVIKTKRAISFVVGSDLHTIGVEMVNTYAESLGIEVHYIGSNLPDRSVLDFIHQLKPDYIFISITLESYTNNLLRLLNILDNDVTIYIGGQGIVNHDVFKDYTNVYVVNKLKEITIR